MQRVCVVDKNQEPLMPCHPARARQLLKEGRAKVLRHQPFTIILLDREGGDIQATRLSLDPGAENTGIAVVADFKRRGPTVIWAANLEHRGFHIVRRMIARSQQRRSRRGRKTRYRQPRFDNRKRDLKWLPPSMQSWLSNIQTWVARLYMRMPITKLTLEFAKFDTQKMEKPEISGVEYQYGTREGKDIRFYVKEKFNYRCAYCNKAVWEGGEFNLEHVVPKSRGGSNRVSNLVWSCRKCNDKKGTQTAEEFGYPELHDKAAKPLRAAAAVNHLRLRLVEALEATGLPLELGTGAQTAFNQEQQGYAKDHWIDAACAGTSGEQVNIPPALRPLLIRAKGWGRRQAQKTDKYGFPRGNPKLKGRIHGFRTGDMVKAVVPKGKHRGTHVGRVAVRATGNFRVGQVDGINHKYCRIVHRVDGYEYQS